MESGHKKCCRCKIFKSYANFSHSWDRKDTYKTTCKPCCKLIRKTVDRTIPYDLAKERVRSCYSCKKTKALIVFVKQFCNTDGYGYVCLDCSALKQKERRSRKAKQDNEYYIKQNLKNLYGMTLDDYNRMRQQQNFACAVCLTPEAELVNRLCVDHDHETGKNRGLLCHACNRGMGLMKENIRTLKNAIAYLEYNLPRVHDDQLLVDR